MNRLALQPAVLCSTPMFLALSLITVGLYLGSLLSASKPALATPMAGAAVAAHAIALIGALLGDGALRIGVTEALSLVSWQSAALLFLLCLRQPLNALRPAIYSLAAICVLCAALWPSPASANPIGDWRIQLHVVLSILSSGLLTLAVAQALVLAAQDRFLHRHKDAWLQRNLPPLQTMESLLFTMLAVGLFLLSLTLITGLLFIDNLFAQHLAHKTVLSICAWVILGVLLWGRWRFGWRGRTAIRWTIAGYSVLILAYFGSKIVLELLLDRHWS